MNASVWSFGPLGELNSTSAASALNVALGQRNPQPSYQVAIKADPHEIADIVRSFYHIFVENKGTLHVLGLGLCSSRASHLSFAPGRLN